jgi:hypothetical protein
MKTHFNNVIKQKNFKQKKNTEFLIEIIADYPDNQEKAHILGSSAL